MRVNFSLIALPLMSALQWSGLALALVLAPLAAKAQSDESLEDLLALDIDELFDYEVVTPTRSRKTLSNSPGAVSVMTYEQIRQSGAQTIPELLRQIPGVNVRWNPMVQTIDIRSFGANPFTSKVLLLIDGVPYNSWNKGGFPQHPGFDFFNLNNVKHIEIVRGSGSALYGENAFNGIINIITLSGEEIAGTRVLAETGSRDTRTLSVVHGSRIGPNSSILASVRALRSQLPVENWTAQNLMTEGYDLFLKAKVGNWRASLYRRDDEVEGFSDPFNNPAFPPGSVVRSADIIEQTVNIAAIQYERDEADEPFSLHANVSYANRDGSHCATCHSPYEDDSFRVAEDHGYQLFANADLQWRGDSIHAVLLGVEARRHDSGDHSHELASSDPSVEHSEDPSGGQHGVAPVTEYDKFAIYVQDQISLVDDRLEVTAGLRYDGATSPDLFSSQTSPRLAVVYCPTEKWTLRGSWNKAIRYPSFSELYQSTGFFVVSTPTAEIPLASFEPNFDLQPERIESLEFGFGVNLSPTWNLRGDMYSNEVDGPIIIAYPRFRFENHPNLARSRGVELELRGQPRSSLRTYINWSYQHNEQRGDGTDSTGNEIEFTYSPRHKVSFGATYTPSEWLSATAEVNWRDEYLGPSFWYPIALGDPEVVPLDDFAYLNVNVRYRPNFFADRPWELRLTAKNLLDERPFESLTGAGRNVGREFFLSIAYRWQN